jgi:hypothetical protein
MQVDDYFKFILGIVENMQCNSMDHVVLGSTGSAEMPHIIISVQLHQEMQEWDAIYDDVCSKHTINCRYLFIFSSFPTLLNVGPANFVVVHLCSWELCSTSQGLIERGR